MRKALTWNEYITVTAKQIFSHPRKYWATEVRNWGEKNENSATIKSHYISRLWNYMTLSIRPWIFSNWCREAKKKYAMLKLVRISWYRGLNDQSVHINETFEGYHSMILHQNQQYTNRKYPSTYSETVSLSDIWYKCNKNNFSICQCDVQILNMISIRLKKVHLLY